MKMVTIFVHKMVVTYTFVALVNDNLHALVFYAQESFRSFFVNTKELISSFIIMQCDSENFKF